MLRARLFRLNQPPVEAGIQEWPGIVAGRDVRLGEGANSADGAVLWIDLLAPPPEEVAKVAQALGVDGRAGERLRRRNVPPSVRRYGDHFLLVTRSLDVDERRSPRIVVSDLALLVGQRYVVSVQERPLGFVDEVEGRIASHAPVGPYDSSYLLYVLLDALVVHYAQEIDDVEDKVERLEERMLREAGREQLNEAVVTQRHVHSLRRLLAPHQQVLTELVAADSPLASHQIETYFRDILEHLNALLDRLDHVRDIVTGSYDLHISNIEERTNRELRVLTYLSAVLLPMTVITGIFGTNFRLAEYDAWEPFYIMLAGMALLTLGLLAFFRWRRWL